MTEDYSKIELLIHTGLVASYVSAQMIIRALDAAGFVIVPKEPTNGMIKAALAGLCDEEPNLPWGHNIGDDGARAIWRVMLQAASS